MKPRLAVPSLLMAAVLTLAAGCAPRSAFLPDPPAGLTADFDLASASDTAAYARISYMQVYTEEYEGKTVMVRGAFTAVPDPETGGYLYKVLVPDGKGCCTRDMEFVPADARAYPADFPKEKREITVVGTFTTYTRNGSLRCRLANAALYA